MAGRALLSLLVPRHDLVAPTGGRRQHAVVRQPMPSRRGYLGRQPRQKRHRVEHDGGPAILPRVSEAVDDVTSRRDRQPLLGQRRTGDIATDPLETVPLAFPDAYCGVERESPVVGAELLLHAGAPLRLALFEHRGAQPRLWPERDQSLDGGGVLGIELVELDAGVRIDALVGIEEAEALQAADDQGADVSDQLVDVRIAQRRGLAKHQRLAQPEPGVDPIEEERVEVYVQAERRVEALHADHGAGAAAGVANVPRAARVERLHRAHEDAADEAQDVRVADHEEADRVGEAEDPLAHRDLGEDVVAQVGGGLGHAAAGARWAHRAGLAGEGDQGALVAVVTVHADEAPGQDAAGQIALELAADMDREAATVVGQVGGDVLLDRGSIRSRVRRTDSAKGIFSR